jgi:hypothetical protein
VAKQALAERKTIRQVCRRPRGPGPRRTDRGAARRGARRTAHDPAVTVSARRLAAQVPLRPDRSARLEMLQRRRRLHLKPPEGVRCDTPSPAAPCPTNRADDLEPWRMSGSAAGTRSTVRHARRHRTTWSAVAERAPVQVLRDSHARR